MMNFINRYYWWQWLLFIFFTILFIGIGFGEWFSIYGK
jgi:hypothetical protein